MIYTLLDITFEASCWLVVTSTKLIYNGVTYFTNISEKTKLPAIAYSGDKQRDVIYAAGLLHHENILDDTTYQNIIDSALLFSLKD